MPLYNVEIEIQNRFDVEILVVGNSVTSGGAVTVNYSPNPTSGAASETLESGDTIIPVTVQKGLKDSGGNDIIAETSVLKKLGESEDARQVAPDGQVDTQLKDSAGDVIGAVVSKVVKSNDLESQDITAPDGLVEFRLRDTDGNLLIDSPVSVKSNGSEVEVIIAPDSTINIQKQDSTPSDIGAVIPVTAKSNETKAVNVPVSDATLNIQRKDTAGTNIGAVIPVSVKAEATQAQDVEAPDAILTDSQGNQLALAKSASEYDIEELMETLLGVTTIESLGGVGDGMLMLSTSTTSGSPTVNTGADMLDQYYVGKNITLTDAGTSGGLMTSTIVSIVGATVTMAANAITTTSAKPATAYTDNTVAFQAAMDLAATESVHIKCTNRDGNIYCIGGALKANSNTQLEVPYKEPTEAYGTLIIEGTGVPSFVGPGGQDTGAGSTIMPSMNNTVILSTIKGSGTLPSIMASAQPVSPPATPQTCISLYLNKVSFRTLPSGLNYTMGYLNLKNFRNSSGDFITVNMWGKVPNIMTAPTSNIIGLSCADTNDTPVNRWSSISIRGCGIGLKFGEHFVGDAFDIRCCVVGVEVTSSFHSNNFTGLTIQWCATYIKTALGTYGVGCYFIGTINIEFHRTGGGTARWYHYDNLLNDSGNLAYGRLTYHMIEGGIGVTNDQAVVVGGVNLNLVELIDKDAVASDPTSIIYSNTFTGSNGGTPTGTGITNSGTQAVINVSGAQGTIGAYARQIEYSAFTIGTRKLRVACQMYANGLTTADCTPRWEFSDIPSVHKAIILRQSTTGDQLKYRVIVSQGGSSIYDSATSITVDGASFPRTALDIDPIASTVQAKYHNGTSWVSMGSSVAVSAGWIAGNFTPRIMNTNPSTGGVARDAQFDNMYITRGDYYTTSEP